MESNYVELMGVKIHYYRTGGDKPAIVMVHGITDSGLCWSGLMEALRDKYDVIMVDARGHGLSDAPGYGYSVEDRVNDLVGLIKKLYLEKPILLGHSLGGNTICRAAAMYPDIPRVLILEDPAGMNLTPQVMAAVRKTREQIIQWNASTREQLTELCKTKVHPGWSIIECEYWADAKKNVSPDIVQMFDKLSDLRQDFPRITCPVLILKADGNDEIKSRNREFAALIPDGRLVHIEGAGHNVRRDKPETTLNAIRKFLSELGV